MQIPRVLAIDRPAAFLKWLATSPTEADLDRVDVAHAWALVGLAALCRKQREGCVPIRTAGETGAARFAHAIGIQAALEGQPHQQRVETARTVPIRRFQDHAEIEQIARDISRLLMMGTEHEDTRPTLEYALLELFRNVVQHSGDQLGGVVAAQVMFGGKGGYSQETVQVAVADNGMGIPESLSGHHPEAADPKVALEHALWPYFSGAFAKDLSGSNHNAGLGLFFVSEMAKLTGGRLVIASRGATLTLEGAKDPEHDSPEQDILDAGYPGTLVGFELGLSRFHDHDALMATIQQRARERTPQRAVHDWLSDAPPPPNTPVLVVAIAAENTAEAGRLSKQELVPRLAAGEPVALDFVKMRTCTQSFAHALLYNALRMAWATRTRIHVLNAAPAVRSTLALLESYALGG